MIFKVPQTAAALPVRRGGFRIITPFFFTGIHVQRQHFTVRRTDIQRVANLQRRVLIFRTRAVALRNIAGVRNPRDFQRADVLLVNLIQRGEAVAVGGVAPVLPVLLLLAGCDGFHRHGLVRCHKGLRLKHPAEADQHGHREQRRDAKSGGFVRCSVVCRTKEGPDDGAQERQHGKGKQAGEERPEIPARIAYRPEQRGNKRDAVKQDPAGAVEENQDRGNHHCHAHYQEVTTPAYGGELKAQPADRQTDEHHQSGKKPLQNTRYSTWRAAKCHFSLL